MVVSTKFANANANSRLYAQDPEQAYYFVLIFKANFIHL